MHEMYPEHTHEEIELLGMDFSMMLFESFTLVPRWRDYYLAHDQFEHYRFLKRALKALQWLRGPKRWIFKSPQHMEQLPAVSREFPDATFAFAPGLHGIRHGLRSASALLKLYRAPTIVDPGDKQLLWQ